MATLSSVAELIMGQSPPSNTYNDRGEGIPFYQGKTDFGFKYPVPRLYCSSPRKIAEVGDILISVRAPVGPTNLVAEKSCIGRGLGAIRAQGLDSDFLYFNLKYIEPYIASLGTGSTFSAINKDQLANIEVNQLGFELLEQQRIAYVLSMVQNAIEQQGRLIKLTRELKSALMHKLFTEGLRGEKQKMTDIGPVPLSWAEIPLEKTGAVVYGIQAAVAKNIKPVGMKILTNKNITLDGQIVSDEINYFELKTKRHFDTVLKKGDILFNWRSGSKEHIGKTAYFNLEEKFTHSSFILRIRPKESVNGKFLFWYLFFLREKGYFAQKHNISSVNTTFNKSAVDALPTYLPSKDEQDKIAATLDIIDSKIDLLKKKRNIQEELFRTLLHQLMTGQTRVNEIDFKTK
ncbi:MAG TPA: restriction endonuclease subunit S [Smithella sp.]|nr:restriction endonuclease subunit S [Smithella sp.]